MNPLDVTSACGGKAGGALPQDGFGSGDFLVRNVQQVAVKHLCFAGGRALRHPIPCVAGTFPLTPFRAAGPLVAGLGEGSAQSHQRSPAGARAADCVRCSPRALSTSTYLFRVSGVVL